jgi:hypothetical protein
MSSYADRPTKPTTSHIMLYIILGVYILVVFCGLGLTGACAQAEDYASASTIMIALFSYSAVCGTSTIVMYVNKAAKENEIKLNMAKYKMKLELAKEIYNSILTHNLDSQSIMLLKNLTEELGLNNNDLPIMQPAFNNAESLG